MQISSIKIKKTFLSVFVFSALTACGGGGGGGSSSSNTVSMGGSAVKGPLANASVEVYSVDSAAANLRGQLVDTGTTNARAGFSGINLNPDNAPYLIVVEADDDTVDITTGAPPVITKLRTIVTAAQLNSNVPIYATPLTSMAVDVVAAQSDNTPENLESQLSNAQNRVKTTLGFGLSQSLDIFTTAPLLTDETDTPEEQQSTAGYRLAIEALSAVIENVSNGTTDTEDTPDNALEALAKDLADGQLDGMSQGEMVAELNGFDVSTLDDVDVNSLTIPGTQISVNDIEQVLNTDKTSTGVDTELDESVDVSATPPVLVADTDLDGFADNLDNCPLNSNENQSDSNANGVGDVCDAAPVIAEDLSATVDEDSSVLIDLSVGASDAEGDDLVYSVGQVTLEGAIYEFQPEDNFNGEISFDYEVSDGTSQTTGTVNVVVAAQNDPGSVTIQGDAVQGQTLTANVVDDIDGLVNASVSYIWSNEAGAIEGEEGSTLLLTQALVGDAITVSVSYTDNEGFQETLQSEATDAVADIDDAPSGELELSGVAREDEVVSVIVDGLSDPDGSIVVVAYQWSSDGTPIDGATAAEFTIPGSVVGTSLSVLVSFTDSVFTSVVSTRTATFPSAVANANDVATGSVIISNTSPAEGDGLVVSLENIQDEDGLTSVDYAYQWLADGEEISGATSSTFIPSQQQVGSVLSVEVSFTDDFGSAESLTSAETSAVTNVNDDPTGSVIISGSAVVGQTLTASNNLTDEDGIGEISYEWFLNSVTTEVTGSSYTVQPADVDGSITVVASYEDAFGALESVTSNPVIGLAEPVEADNSLVGSWDLNLEEFGTYDKTIISFTATGEFFFFNVNSLDDDNCRSTGYEYGTYERVGDNINLTRIIDTDGCVGIFDATENQSQAQFVINDEETTKLEVTIIDPDQTETALTWTRILSNSDSIVGSWHEVFEGQEGNLSNLVIFLGDGRMYAMDADINDLQENDFFYGDYTYDGSNFTRTWVFQGFSDNTFAENNNTQIIDNRLVSGPDDSLGRNVPDLENASAPLAFTEAELEAGFTWYFVGPYDDCPSEWLVEEMSFDAIGYSLDLCASGSGEEVDEAYEVLASGVVRLVAFNEYIRRASFDPRTQSYDVCYADSEQAALDCGQETQGLAFVNRADAQDYVGQQLSNSLIGSWDFHIEENDTYDKTILTFTATGEFFFFNVSSFRNEDCRSRGYEYGTYERVGNDINLTRVIDTNGCVGLFDATENQSEATFTITEEETTSITASIFDPIDDPLGTNPDVLTWTRIQTNEDSIVGSWHEELGEGGENNQGNNLSNLVLFLGDGRFYTMDADPTNTSENDFGYGDYVADLGGEGLTLTFRFDGTGGETLGVENNFPNAAIVENEFSVNTLDDQIGLGRVVPAITNASAPLAFTETELSTGFTWFFALLEPEDCGNQWVVEEMNFDATGYSLDVCGSGSGEEVDEAYSLLASGIVNLVATQEYVKRMSFDAELQAYLVCWEDTELAASDCAEESQGYAFLSRADAQAYADEQDAPNSIDLTQYSISSTMTNSDCPSATPLGWDYVFTETDVTLSGSDSIITSNGVCSAGAQETFVDPIVDYSSSYQGSFWTCEDYPVCTVSELNRTYDGLDYDGDEAVLITISHPPGSNTITWIQEEDLGSTWTEIITLTPLP